MPTALGDNTFVDIVGDDIVLYQGAERICLSFTVFAALMNYIQQLQK